jgi:hypothetical protein
MRKNPWNNPEYRKKMLRKRRETAKRPEVQRKKRKAMFKLYKEQPDRLQRKSRQSKKMWASRSVEEKLRIGRKISKKTTEQNLRQWADSKFHAKMVLARRKQGKKIENIRKLSKGSKRAWRRKEYREKQKKTRSASYAYNVTRHEKTSKALIGRPSWNAGQTKDTHPSLAALSKRMMGRVPDWKKYGQWYKGRQGKIWMRSSWEVAYAKWLDKNGIAWEYELKYFYIGKGRWTGETYTPDFYLKKEAKYVEVKGHLSPANARKMVAFRKRYPKVVVEILGRKELLKLGVPVK